MENELPTRAVWTDGAVYASGVDLHLRGDRGGEGGPHPVGEWAKSGVHICATKDTCLRTIEATSQREQGCALNAVSGLNSEFMQLARRESNAATSGGDDVNLCPEPLYLVAA